MQENKKEIQQHYILSRNRSGSTLLNNLLNNHPNIISISELNVYWLLQRDYKNIKNFSSTIIVKLIEDLFFVLEKKGQEYYKYTHLSLRLFFTLFIFIYLSRKIEY